MEQEKRISENSEKYGIQCDFIHDVIREHTQKISEIINEGIKKKKKFVNIKTDIKKTSIQMEYCYTEEPLQMENVHSFDLESYRKDLMSSMSISFEDVENI